MRRTMILATAAAFGLTGFAFGQTPAGTQQQDRDQVRIHEPGTGQAKAAKKQQKRLHKEQAKLNKQQRKANAQAAKRAKNGPGDGTGNMGGPRDGTGYGNNSGQRTGPQDGTAMGQPDWNNRGGGQTAGRGGGGGRRGR